MEVIEGAKWVSWLQRTKILYFSADPGHISGRIGQISNHRYRPIGPEIWPGSAEKYNGWIKNMAKS